MILALSISAIAFALLGVFCLASVAKDHPQRGIRVGGVKPFQSRSIENRLALGLLAQNTKSNKRKP